MKHIHSKNDWFYEFRPLMIQAIGIFGVVSSYISAQGSYGKMSLTCGAVLLGIGQLIMHWRREYRARNPL